MLPLHCAHPPETIWCSESEKYCRPYTYPFLLLYRTHSIFRTPNIKWIPADGLSTGVAWEAAEPETKEICIGGCAIEPWPASSPWGEWGAWTIWGRPQHKEGPLHLHLATKKTLVRHSSTLILQVCKFEKKHSYVPTKFVQFLLAHSKIVTLLNDLFYRNF